jgi:hypothetical protein
MVSKAAARKEVIEVRLGLLKRGFTPVACRGKDPILPNWPNLQATPEQVARWGGGDTGIATRLNPATDIDIGIPEPAAAVEEVAKDWFADRGAIPVRFGRAPRRALLFRTVTPFAKITTRFLAADGSRHAIEFLGDGQQLVVHGPHAVTGLPYSWHGGLRPWEMTQADLVEITEQEAREFLAHVTDVLKEQFGFTLDLKSNGHDAHSPFTAGGGAPIDIDAQLAELDRAGPDDAGAVTNEVQRHVVPSLLRKGMHPDDVREYVVAETMTRLGGRVGWSQAAEIQCVTKRILAAYKNVLLKDYNPASGVIPGWLPGEFLEPWTRVLKAGGAPMLHLTRYGFCIKRAQQDFTFNHSRRAEKDPQDETPQPEPKSEPPRSEPGSTEPLREPPRKFRFKLMSFADLRPGPEPLYLVDELFPIAGLVDVWGKAKCYKSFWCLDVMLHVAMGWEYRDRYVRQGAVVYCAFEGAHGYKKRIEALRRHYAIENGADVPLYVMPGQANLIADHGTLISDIKAQLNGTAPITVVLDTLNKSLYGSENKDVDMGQYIRAAEAIRDAFGCVVIIVHHCGYDDTRPRGHSSLPGAVDAQLSVTRIEATVTVTVEMMRDGPEDTVVTSTAQSIEVGHDQNGKALTSLVLVPGETPEYQAERRTWPRALTVFHAALKHALSAHGVPYQPEVGVPPVRAVDLEAVRDQFKRTYAPDEEDEEKRQDAVRKAFKRNRDEAEKRGMVCSRPTDTGEVMLWVPDREHI